MRRLSNLLLVAFLLGVPLSSFSANRFEIFIDPATNPKAGIYSPVTVRAYNDLVQDSSFTGTVNFTNNTFPGSITPTVSGNFSGGEWFGSLQFTAAGENDISCNDGSAIGNTLVSVSPGAMNKLLVVLPGQTHTPGISPGVTPTADPIILIGLFYGVTVLATDAYYNHVTTSSDVISKTQPPPSVMNFYPEPNSLTNGITHYTIQANAPGGFMTISLNSTANSAIAYSGSLTAISANTGFTHTSAPSQVIAGEDFYVSVSVSADSDDSNTVMTNNNDNYTFKIFDASSTSEVELPDVLGRDSFSDATASNGIIPNYYPYFRTAMQIYLKVEKIGGTSGQTIIPLSSNVITVNPNVPASVQISFSPPEVQSKHESIVSVTVFDAYGNPTNSSLHDFSVTFSKASDNGYLSNSITATNSSGIATSTYTAGILNEQVTIDVSVIDNNTQSIYTSASQIVKVSVAPTEPGKIVNYPNPFNPAKGGTTSINYYLEEASDIELRIFDAFGRIVYSQNFNKDDGDVISANATAAGGAVWGWDGKNGEGKVVANGIYHVRITARMPGKTQVYKRRVGVIK